MSLFDFYCSHRSKIFSTSLFTTNASVLFLPVVDSLFPFHFIHYQSSNGYMVAFAGRKYAARSPPIFVADEQHAVTSFTLVSSWHRK